MPNYIITSFRQYAVALKADIKDMFFCVQMRKEDRGAQRFLWRARRETNTQEYMK